MSEQRAGMPFDARGLPPMRQFVLGPEASAAAVCALVMVEYGAECWGPEGGRCPDCTCPKEALAPRYDAAGPLDLPARKRSPTGHYADVECLVDIALTAAVLETREKRDKLRQAMIAGTP